MNIGPIARSLRFGYAKRFPKEEFVSAYEFVNDVVREAQVPGLIRMYKSQSSVVLLGNDLVEFLKKFGSQMTRKKNANFIVYAPGNSNDVVEVLEHTQLAAGIYTGKPLWRDDFFSTLDKVMKNEPIGKRLLNRVFGTEAKIALIANRINPVPQARVAPLKLYGEEVSIPVKRPPTAPKNRDKEHHPLVLLPFERPTERQK